jgi:hypothetical protein
MVAGCLNAEANSKHVQLQLASSPRKLKTTALSRIQSPSDVNYYTTTEGRDSTTRTT